MASNNAAPARSLACTCQPGRCTAELCCWAICSFLSVSLATLPTQHLFLAVSFARAQPGHALAPGGALGDVPKSPTALRYKHAWVGEETWSCRSQDTREGCISNPPFNTNQRLLSLRSVILTEAVVHHHLQGGGCGQVSWKAPKVDLSCFREGGRGCSAHTEGHYLADGCTGPCQGLGPLGSAGTLLFLL